MVLRTILYLVLMMAPLAAAAFQAPDCADKACGKLRRLAEEEKYEKLIGAVEAGKQYSEAARYYIGKAYLELAAKDGNTPGQEEQYCRKALEYGQLQAYMGLYFINAQKDPERALGFLREYVLTAPADPVPFVILGESEMEKENYKAADIFLREAKRVSRAHSPRVDWLLFQTNYHLKDYAFAGAMLASALENGRFDAELKTILVDEHYKGIEKRPEFRKYRDVFKEVRKNS